MKSPATVQDYPALKEAIRYLAGRCDGALTLDEMGFDGTDTKRGHRLADKETWLPVDARWALVAARKYHRQIPEDLRAEITEEAKTVPKKGGEVLAQPHGNDLVSLTFDYDEDLVARVKSLPGRRWSPKERFWTLPLASLPAARQSLGDRLVEENLPATVEVPEEEEHDNVELDAGGDLLVLRTPIEVKDEIKERLAGRKWDPNERCWTAPASPANLAAVLEIARSHLLTVNPGVEERSKTATAEAEAERAAATAASIEDAPIRIPGFTLELRPFQAAGVQVARSRKRVLIGDAMGLGKTIQALATLEAEGAYPAVVVVPATLRGNWRNEAKRALPSNRYVHAVMNGKDHPTGKEDVVIVSYEGMVKHLDRLVKLGPRAVVFDEAHYVKNRKAKRTGAARVLAGRPKKGRGRDKGDLSAFDLETAADPEYVLALTGTAILNRPAELIEPLTILGRLDDVGGFWHVANRYCGYVQGNGFGEPEHLPELHKRLLETCMVRRRKEDVLTELPPKTRTILKVEVSNKAEIKKAGKETAKWYAHNKGTATPQQFQAQGLVEINNLRKLSGAGKVDAVVKLLKDYLENEEPVVVFTHHHHVTDAIAEKTPGARVLDGRTPHGKRTELVEEFQAGKVPVLVCGIKAAGVGLTLTRATSVLLVELPWTMADVQQAEDRLHRIGQENAVNAYWVLGEDTIDEAMAMVLEEKARIVDQALDGIAAEDEGEGGLVKAVLEAAFGRRRTEEDEGQEEEQ